MTIDHPLRLAVGSHQAGSGQGCAMNVISWESGDTTITDLPACADLLLARVVQNVNDRHCTHREGSLLCAPCSLEVLALAHRTVGTALDLSDDERRRIYVRLALDEAESVARPDEDGRVTACRASVARSLECTASLDEVRAAYDAAAAYAAAYAAAAAAYAAAAYAVAAASYAAAAAASYAAAYDAAAAASYAAASASYAADSAASADDAAADRLKRAHALIDRFEKLTGVRATTVPVTTTQAAIAAMTTARA